MTTLAAPPSSSPPPSLSPGGRTAARAALVVAALVLVVGVVAGLGVTAWAVSTFRVSTDSAKLPTTMRSLTLDTGEVPVAVRISADREATEPRVNLRLFNATRTGDQQLNVSTEGGDTRIGIAGESTSLLGWARGGELTVTLPPDQARRLKVSTQHEIGVLLVQADLDELIARSTHSSVVLSGAARRVQIHTTDGGVSSRDPISVTEEFIANTSDGNISVDFRDEAPNTVEAVSRGGDIYLRLPQPGPYLVRAQSSQAAKVRVPETNNPANAVAEVTARSDNGDVLIEDLPARRGGR